jgi:hypothetical protein
LVHILRAGLIHISAVVAALFASRPAFAVERPAVEGDAIRWQISADSYFRLFQRAPVPGPRGSVLAVETAVPFYQHALLAVEDIDVPWAADSTDVELAAWGNVELADAQDSGRRADGDITVARVRHRVGPGYIAAGRQIYAGGAARFVRLDGIVAGASTPFGLGVDAYGGFTVLPRWNARPGYHALGSASDTLVRDPTALPDPSRSEHWLAGGRAHYRYRQHGEIGLSFHEQQEDGAVGRRSVGSDLRLSPLDELTLRAQTIVDVDASALSEAKVMLDLAPRDRVDIGLGYFHAVPALFLSRQSVLSVFSTAAYDEIGADLAVRPWSALTLGAEGWGQRFEGGDFGARAGARMRLTPKLRQRPTLTLGYRRVAEYDNGYHSLRAAVAVWPAPPLLLATETFTYLYDEAIAGVTSSFSGAQSARYQFDHGIALTLSASVARTPYAEHDVQGLARVELVSAGGGR